MEKTSTSLSKPKVREFLRALVSDGLSRISGGLSVPFTALSLFLDAHWAKTLFAVLAIIAFVVASYRVWANERDHHLEECHSHSGTLTALRSEIDKRGRPEIAVDLRCYSSSESLDLCLTNHSSKPALNVSIDDIPCDDGVVKFNKVPTRVLSDFSPYLESYIQKKDGDKEYDVFSRVFRKGQASRFSDEKRLAVRYTDLDGKNKWVTLCRFAYDFTERKLVLRKQWIEEADLQKVREALQQVKEGKKPQPEMTQRLYDDGLIEAENVSSMDTPAGKTDLLPRKLTANGRRVLDEESEKT